MAVISVVTDCEETAEQLAAVLHDRGHVVRSLSDSELTGERLLKAEETEQGTGLFVVDADCSPSETVSRVRAITEEWSTALTPVLVAASASSERELALACAYGASGLLRKPFRTVETVPDTESALAAAYPAG